jgi:hypothetical protein
VRLPVPQGCEHSVHAVQSSTKQSIGSNVGAAVGVAVGAAVGETVGVAVGAGVGTGVGAGVGQGSALQPCSCSISAGQAKPPFAASSTTSRIRVWVPPPHSTVQFAQSSQSDITQSCGQGSTLQSLSSQVLGHAAPPWSGWVTSRVRFCIPPSQVAEQVLYSPHGPMTQSTGHGCVLQTWKSTFPGYFGQAAPPYMGWVRFRYRRCSPAPQGSLHSVQGAQAPIWQSTGSCVGTGVGKGVGAGVGMGVGQASVLQSSTSIISASSGHMIPPQESDLSTTRKRVCSPPPQVALHSPHADQSETSQSSAQHMVLQS